MSPNIRVLNGCWAAREAAGQLAWRPGSPAGCGELREEGPEVDPLLKVALLRDAFAL